MTERSRRLVTGGVAACLVATLLPFAGAVTAATPSSVSVGDAAITEPTARTGQVALELPVTVTPASATAVSVDWRTVAGSANVSDFVNAAGTLSIPAGAQGGTIVLGIRADKVTEGTESFTVQLTGATGATLADANGSVSIRPTATGLALGDVTALEPDGGTLTVAVAATLPAAPKKDVTIGWQLRSATGTVGSDAPAASGTTKIAKGAFGTVIRVAVNGDTADEPDETLELVVTSVTNASLADGIGIITLRNGDVPPPPPDPFGWNPPTGAVPASGTALYVESPAGDFVGQGRTYLYTKANSVLAVGTTANRVTLNVTGDEDWSATFAEPAANPSVVTGYWENLGRYPFHVPGLSFSGEGRGCNNLLGRFIVDQISFTGSTLSTLTVRFEQRCEVTGPPLRGFLRYDAADPTVPPAPGDPAAFTWHAPAGVLPATGNYLYIESSPGDFIGRGETHLYTDGDTAFSSNSGGRLVAIHLEPATLWWDARFISPNQMTQLTTGLYENVRRWPFHNPTRGGMDFSGMGRGCNELLGTFAVDQITWSGTALQSVTIRFVQRCELTGPPLYGTVHWEAPAP